MGEVSLGEVNRLPGRSDEVGVDLLEDLTLMLFTVLTVALNIPQAARLWKTRDAAGLSVAALLSGTVGYAAWIVYLSAQGQWVAMAATAVAAVLWVGITGYTVARRGAGAGQVGHAVGYAAVLAGLALVDLRVFGVALSLGAVWAVLPSVLEAWRAARITGLSVPSWGLYTAESLSWLAWALMISDPVLVLYGVLATTLGALVLAALVVRTEARHPESETLFEAGLEAEPSVAADPVNPVDSSSAELFEEPIEEMAYSA